jgi:Zinc-binding dehydrogenase
MPAGGRSAAGRGGHRPRRRLVRHAGGMGRGAARGQTVEVDHDIIDARNAVLLLVHGGAGGVGSLAVQLGRWKGAHVIATTSSGNVEHVRSLGADEVIDYTKTNFGDAVRDVDVVLDTVGGEVTDRSWSVLKPGGIIGRRGKRAGPGEGGGARCPDVRSTGSGGDAPCAGGARQAHRVRFPGRACRPGVLAV